MAALAAHDPKRLNEVFTPPPADQPDGAGEGFVGWDSEE